MIETKKETEKTVLVSFLNKKNKDILNLKESQDELKFLAETAGAEVVKTYYQSSDKFDSRYVIGKGKVNEIAEYVEEKNISLVILENELAFTQLRNL